jgi:hypothetical protein
MAGILQLISTGIVLKKKARYALLLCKIRGFLP